ncbi:MAG TPA: HTH domain-containing protein [Anaeromyxobacteraceae bacterium]|nr:HTH domain-containing protein [Anaeromyxobacteraceae bacterium]
MTFTEAAIEVLRREGKPLHFKKIAEIAVRDSLLDHIGKIPEEVMGGQLANHCRLPRSDRAVAVVQPGTFALVEWGLDEDPQGLDGIVEPPPENELPYRPRERHPIPSKEMARSVGRGAEQRARRREEGEERRGRRFPPPAEVAFEILAGADHALSLAEIASQGAERALMPDAFVRDSSALAAALVEDNRRRESAGRKPLFAIDGESVSLAAQPEPGERAAVVLPAVRPAAAVDVRRAALLALRRRLRECDGPTIEYVAAALLEKLDFRELKVAKRGREHVVYTARKKMGLGDVRHCVRVMRGAGEIARREITELRRDIGNYGAQIGVVLSAGEPGREARADATASGQLPVILLCGDALAEAMAEAVVGCKLVVVPEVDEAFFKAAADAAAQEEGARKARREERERRENEAREERRQRAEERSRREKPAAAATEPAPAVGPAAVSAADESAAAGATVEETATAASRGDAARTDEGRIIAAAEPAAVPGAAVEEPEEGEGDEGDEEEGSEEAGSQAAAGESGAATPEGEPRKRRRRRRRRGGRGRGERREGAAGAAPGGGASAGGGAATASAGPDAQPAGAGASPPAEGSTAAPAIGPAAETATTAPRETATAPDRPGSPDEPREPKALLPPAPGDDGGESR